MSRWRTLVLSLFSVTLMAKLVSLLFPVPLLREPDPVLGLAIVNVMVAAALLELAICLTALLGRDDRILAYEVIAFGVLALGYRILAGIGDVDYCPCLGNIAG